MLSNQNGHSPIHTGALQPTGIHLVLGNNGRPNGEAFVEFGSEEQADAALAKDRGSIGSRYVEVFRSNPEQMHQVRTIALLAIHLFTRFLFTTVTRCATSPVHSLFHVHSL